MSLVGHGRGRRTRQWRIDHTPSSARRLAPNSTLETESLAFGVVSDATWIGAEDAVGRVHRCPTRMVRELQERIRTVNPNACGEQGLGPSFDEPMSIGEVLADGTERW